MQIIKKRLLSMIVLVALSFSVLCNISMAEGLTTLEVTEAQLIDIEFNGGSVPGFDPAIMEYDLVVPYEYIENDFNTVTMPVVNATAADGFEAEVVYPQTVNNGTILINVTDPAGVLGGKQYKLNLTEAGKNKFPDGGFEGDTESVWYKGTGTLAFVSDADSIGEKVMEYSCDAYTRYLYDINYGITLPGNKTYLTSNMVKAAPDTTVPMSVQVVTRHGVNTSIPGVTYWSVEGNAIENSVTLTHDWQTRQSTFSAANDLTYYTTMYITYDAMDPIHLDEHYVGELLISSVAVKDASGQPTATIGIPAETKTINLNASVLNQMGTKAGFILSGDNANVNMSWRALGNPAGVSVSNGVVTVSPEAEAGTVIIEAVAQPTYPGAAQTEVSGRYKLVIDSSIVEPDIDDPTDDEPEISTDNMVTNGGFETGDFSGWNTTSLNGTTEISEEVVFDGQYSAHFSDYAADGMIFPAGITIRPSKRYLLSFAARLEPTDTIPRDMDVYSFGQSGVNITMPYRSEELPLKINGQIWQTAVVTVDTDNMTSDFLLRVSPTMWLNIPYYLDNYYVGELVIDDIAYEGETSVEIPKTGEAAKQLTIETVLKNQLGTSNGLNEEMVTLELVGGAKAGVNLEGNVLSVSEEAVCQTVTIKASCTPSYLGASQTSFSKNIEIELTSTEQLPAARGVEVVGTVEKGQVLVADYTYYSAQGVAQGASVYQWYYCDTENGTYLPIEEEGADTLNYTVSEARKNSFIYFEVCPKDINGVAGAPVKSRILRKPTAPVVNENEIKILGTMALGETLTGSYKFFDANNDAEVKSPAENCTTYQWYRSNQDGSYSPIDGETGLNYTITTDDIDCYLKFEVTPRTAVEPKVGATATSKPVLCAVRPTVKNLTIEKKSQSLYVASYQYEHAHGFAEGASQFKWYLNGNLIGTDSKVILSSNASGTLVLELVPVTSLEPSVGATVSTSRTVSSKINVVGSNKGGPGGSISSGSLGYIPVPVPPVETTTPIETPVQSKHWASDAIEYVLNNGIMQNGEGNDFGVDQLVTRAEFVSYIIRAINQQGIPYQNGFSDVSATDDFADELQKAVEIGMISEAEQFYPKRPVARDEICKILLFALGEENCSEDDATAAFSNLQDGNLIAEWAYGYVRKAMSIGLMNGVGNNEFMPRGNVTRAQTAVLAMRIASIISTNGGVAE